MSYPGPPPDSWLRQRWRTLWEGGLDLLYPPSCSACDTPCRSGSAGPVNRAQGWFCPGCQESLIPVDAPYCTVCGEPFDGAMTGNFKCWNCEGRRIAFDFAVAGYKAEGPVREVIHRFKYHRQIALRAAMSDLLLEALKDPRLQAEDLSQWLLVPVPLHFWRERQREFNQSWEMCRLLSFKTGIPAAQVLRRRRRTQMQAHLDRRERLANMRGVFAIRRSWLLRKVPDISGRRILLVDDVLTTGATTHACAKVLKQKGGAEKVVVITAARG